MELSALDANQSPDKTIVTAGIERLSLRERIVLVGLMPMPASFARCIPALSADERSALALCRSKSGDGWFAIENFNPAFEGGRDEFKSDEDAGVAFDPMFKREWYGRVVCDQVSGAVEDCDWDMGWSRDGDGVLKFEACVTLQGIRLRADVHCIESEKQEVEGCYRAAALLVLRYLRFPSSIAAEFRAFEHRLSSRDLVEYFESDGDDYPPPSDPWEDSHEIIIPYGVPIPSWDGFKNEVLKMPSAPKDFSRFHGRPNFACVNTTDLADFGMDDVMQRLRPPMESMVLRTSEVERSIHARGGSARLSVPLYRTASPATRAGNIRVDVFSTPDACRKAYRRALKDEMLEEHVIATEPVPAACTLQIESDEHPSLAYGIGIVQGLNRFRMAACLGNLLLFSAGFVRFNECSEAELFSGFEACVVALAGLAASSNHGRLEPDAIVVRAIADLSEVERAIAKVARDVEPFVDRLAARRLQLLVADDYGLVDDAKWLADIERFVETALVKVAPTAAIEPRIVEVVDVLVQRHLEAHPNYASASEASPLDYELFCAREMERLGWVARVTKASGDQGIDVIAKKGGITAVLQCKRVAAPVGNRAVQEVIAGRAFVRATLAAVVSTAPYTHSARELAAAAGILLLHHAELAKLDREVMHAT